MSAPMKKRLTKDVVLHLVHKGDAYDIPKSIADKYKVPTDSQTSQEPSDGSMLTDEYFAELDCEYTKPGVLLRGIRVRGNLSQVEFAKIIGVSQSDLSKMELGTRPIGKIVAKRIAEKFDINYRSLLG